MDNVMTIAILTYVLAAIIMFIIPESWFPKKVNFEDIGWSKREYLKSRPKRGYYRKLFLFVGLAALVILFLVNTFLV